MKLIARTGKSPESHPLEAVVCLQVCEAHLNTLSLVSGFGKCLCLHLPSCGVACILMDIARDLARIRRGAALRSYWAHVAVPLRGAVQQGASVVHGTAGLKQFPIGRARKCGAEYRSHGTGSVGSRRRSSGGERRH
jgi:hypothetical protein